MVHNPHASSEPTGVVSAETLAALRTALQLQLTAASPDSELREVLHRFSREARANGVRAEHALILLHGLWDSLPEMQQAATWRERQSFLSRLVTICLDQYFADE